MTPTPTPPAVSPTGQTVVSQLLVRIAITVFGVAGAIAMAPTAGVDVSFLPPLVPKYCALIAFVAGFVGLAGPGIRKTAPVLLLVLGLASCAHAPSPLVITGETLHAAALSFEATAAGMAAANEQHLLTADQRAKWNAFLPKFKASFHLACDLWNAAADAQDKVLEQQALTVIATLLAELSAFTALLTSTDGGTS